MELPLDFVPQPVDGEVHEFFLLSLDDIATIVGTTYPDEEAANNGAFDNVVRNATSKNVYKDNCNLVLLDFLVRHGVLTPDVAGYLDIVKRLRSGDCS